MSAWGASWGNSWGATWGADVDVSAPPMRYTGNPSGWFDAESIQKSNQTVIAIVLALVTSGALEE